MNSTSSRSILSINAIIDSVNKKFPNSTYNSEAIKEPLRVEFEHSNLKQKILPIDYISGLFDGDGCLSFLFSSKHRYIGCNFTIIQHIDDYSVLILLKDFFNCGKILIIPSGNAARFSVRSMKDILKYVKPVLEIMSLNTVKRNYLVPSYEAWDIISKKGTQREENFRRVVDLVYTINKEGKNRNIEKKFYLSKMIK